MVSRSVLFLGACLAFFLARLRWDALSFSFMCLLRWHSTDSLALCVTSSALAGHHGNEMADKLAVAGVRK